MRLELSTEEVRALSDALQEYLPGLRREASRTEERGLRHELVQREEMIERLLARLASETARA